MEVGIKTGGSKFILKINKWAKAIIRNPRVSYCPAKMENY